MLLAGSLFAEDGRLAAPFLSDPDARTYLFTIPAERGKIVDRHGKAFARNREVQRAALLMNKLTDSQDKTGAVKAGLGVLKERSISGSLLTNIDEERLGKHWDEREYLPLPYTDFLNSTEIANLRKSPRAGALMLQNEWVREYPQKRIACHLIGYVAREAPAPSGPVLPYEPLFAPVHGAVGLERALNKELSGQEGVLCVMFRNNGETREDQVLRPPQPGATVTLSIDRNVQNIAEDTLAAYGRPGAIAIVHVATGDVLALASNPGFDLSEFSPSISADRLAYLQKRWGQPFFGRAHSGQYPPGSIFKPIVALSGLSRGAVGPRTRLSCGPSLMIAGREFHNWDSTAWGYYDVRDALMRSNNTWFYRVGLRIGGPNIMKDARYFGLGQKPDLPLDNLAAGTLPTKFTGDRLTANLAIGQGPILVSPLQMAVAMAGLANKTSIPKARLVTQIEYGPPGEPQVITTPIEFTRLPYRHYDMTAVRDGMWRVVHSYYGTGKKAAIKDLTLFGKTGTAEWIQQRRKRHLAWFSGWAGDGGQTIAYAALLEGRPGEILYGGKVVAPMMKGFLTRMFADPDNLPAAPELKPIIHPTPKLK